MKKNKKKLVKTPTLYVVAEGVVGGVFTSKKKAESTRVRWSREEDADLQVVEVELDVAQADAREHYKVLFDAKGRLRSAHLEAGVCISSTVLRLREGDYSIPLDLDPCDYSMIEAIEEAQRLLRLYQREQKS